MKKLLILSMAFLASSLFVNAEILPIRKSNEESRFQKDFSKFKVKYAKYEESGKQKHLDASVKQLKTMIDRYGSFDRIVELADPGDCAFWCYNNRWACNQFCYQNHTNCEFECQAKYLGCMAGCPVVE